MMGQAKGKLLLFGEHAAVHGYPALGLTLPMVTTVNYLPGDSWNLEAISPGYRPKLFEVLESLDKWKPMVPGRLEITSDVPENSGYGSSGALCGALVKAFYPGLDENLIWEGANEGEKVFHGRPSGIDTGLALGHGLHSFFPRPNNLPQRESPRGSEFHFITASLPRQGSTRSLVEDLHKRLTLGETSAMTGIKKLGSLAVHALALLEAGGEPMAYQLGQTAQEAQSILSNLGLGHPSLDKILTWASSNGALGGKLSGAGAGGAFYLIYPSAQTALTARLALDAMVKEQNLVLSSPLYAFTWDTWMVKTTTLT